ncbi:MAG: hypothetical protein V4577_24090 [Bacteroidota bacterium]
MKRTLVTLFIIFCLFNNARGQSAAAAIDSLIKFKVITTQDRPMINWALKEKGVTNWRVGVLGGLSAVMLKKRYHIDLRKNQGFMSVNFSGTNKRWQDSVNISLRPLLENIKKAGLLNDRIYRRALAGIDSGRYQADVVMVRSLGEMSFRLEWLAPAKLLPVAKQLHEAGIVSDSLFIGFENDIKAEKIESVIELNKYCRLDRIISMAKYPDDPNIWLEQLHRDIASILPNLNFTGFSYTAIPDTSYSLPGVRFMISLNCNGRTYKHLSPSFLTRDGEVKPGHIFLEDFYRIFNKILTDQQSPLRLHSIIYTYGNDGDNYSRWAFIALNAKQAEAIMAGPCLSYMFATTEDYDNTLTSAKIDSLVAGWRDIGLFAHLSDAEISKAMDKAIAADRYPADVLLNNFPGVVYTMDSIFNSPELSYKMLLFQLAKITHGKFSPVKISEHKDKNGLTLRYFSNGKPHSYRFRSKFWMGDKNLPAFIRGLGTENGLDGNFYMLPYREGVIYLTKQQHSAALEKGLLELESGGKSGKKLH